MAEVGVRPGVLVDTLEQALLFAEQERVVDREAMRLPDAPSAPSGKPRTSLHMPDRQPTSEPEPAIVRTEADDVAAAEAPPADGAASTPTPEDADPPAPEPDAPADNVPEAQEGKEEESEVDRILLAKEFAGLLQVPREDDEASR